MTDYIVFHTTEAGSPNAYLAIYGQHGWVFEPAGFNGDLFSKLYSSRVEAETAAEDWAAAQEWEADAEEEAIYY